MLGIRWCCLPLLMGVPSRQDTALLLNPPCCPGLELNGMTGMDVAEVPPPLPLKGSMADYGNLMDSQDLMGSPPPPPPPPHHRVSGSPTRASSGPLLPSSNAPFPMPACGRGPGLGLIWWKGHGDHVGHLWACHGDTCPEVALDPGKGQEG